MLRMILPIRPIAGAVVPAVLDDALGEWSKVVGGSLDACLVLDDVCRVAAISAAAARYVGEPADAILGRFLLEVISIVDFTEVAAPGEAYKRSIAPIAAVRDNHLHRGLLRLRRTDGQRVTLDAVAAPIRGPHGKVTGSITFFASL
jgi:PAS domain-containing protein